MTNSTKEKFPDWYSKLWTCIIGAVIGVITCIFVLTISNTVYYNQSKVYTEAREQCYILTDDVRCLLLASVEHENINQYLVDQYADFIGK